MFSNIGVMPRKPLFDYDRLLLSGVPIYVQNGVDYTVTTEAARSAIQRAARSRGLSVVTSIVHEYDGFVFQAYVPGTPRPVLPPPPVADFTKESHKFLFCSVHGCENKLRPLDQIDGLCDEHKH